MSRPATAAISRGAGRVIGVAFVSFLLVTLLPTVSWASGVIQGQVTAEGGPVASATVFIAGGGEIRSGSTDVDGRYSIDVPNDTYTLSVRAPGHSATTATGIDVADATVTRDVALSASSFSPLPVFGGAQEGVVADGESGVFYAPADVVPQLFRTSDFGGSWTPVTLSIEDPANGLESEPIRFSRVATSGQPGEVAAIVRQTVYFSKDFGLSWTAVEGALPPRDWTQPDYALYWGHAGSTSVLLVVAPDGTYRVDVSADAPTLQQMEVAYAGPDDALDVANGAGAPYVVVATGGGAIKIAELTASGGPQFGPALDGFPTSPFVVTLGGAASLGPSGEPTPPDGVLVVGQHSGQTAAVMATKPSGNVGFEAGDLSAPSRPSNWDADCHLREDFWQTASVSPISTGAGGTGNIQACWVEKSGADSLSFASVNTNGTMFAYDAAYDGTDNRVIFSSDGAHGPIKSADADLSSVPIFPWGARLATAGTAPESGGRSISGITATIVRDTTYGPTGTSQVATSVATWGGSVSLASDDGGQTMETVVDWGGNAVDWWSRADGSSWLLFGHGGHGNQLSAFLDWTRASPAIDRPNVSGSEPADLGWSGSTTGFAVSSLEGVPGTDTVFVGSMQFGGGQTLTRGELTPSQDGGPPSLTTKLQMEDPVLRHGIAAMAYCPVEGSDPSLQDVLLVATADASGPTTLAGAFVRVENATAPAPAPTLVESVLFDAPNTAVRDVSADCASGKVYVGTRSNGPNAPSLYHSSDGGRNFVSELVPTPQTGALDIAAIGLDGGGGPAGNDEVVVSGQEWVLTSTDGGENFTVVNDPRVDQPLDVTDIEVAPEEAPPPPPAPGTVGQAADVQRLGTGADAATIRLAQALAPGSSETLIGSGSGAFTGDLGVGTGIFDVAKRSSSWLGEQVSPQTDDTAPALATQGDGTSHVVFSRADGFYYASQSGGWSLPEKVPGSLPGDSQASVAVDKTGKVHLALRRTETAPGIYYGTRSTSGTWSSLRALSSGAADSDPALGVVSGKADVTFTRKSGTAGIYYLTNRSGKWSTPRKISGTGPSDGQADLASRSDHLYLAFARSKGKPGIYYAGRSLKNSTWGAARQLSSGSADKDPSLVVDSDGRASLVFHRRTGSSTGLFHVRKGRRDWKTSKIAGTTAADRTPSLVAETKSLRLHLAFARGGALGGIFSATNVSGSWSRPSRRTNISTDVHPSIAVSGSGSVDIVFQRS